MSKSVSNLTNCRGGGQKWKSSMKQKKEEEEEVEEEQKQEEEEEEDEEEEYLRCCVSKGLLSPDTITKDQETGILQLEASFCLFPPALWALPHSQLCPKNQLSESERKQLV